MPSLLVRVRASSTTRRPTVQLPGGIRACPSRTTTSSSSRATSFDGPALRFDWPGLRVGIAEYEEGPTGCTVFQFLPAGAACATDVRGGSPGQLGGFEWVHAICLAGGSLYGLEAATGVSAEILAQRGHEVGWTNIPNVSGAIVYDFGRRDTTVYPDKALGPGGARRGAGGRLPARRARRGPGGERRQDVRARARRGLRPGRGVPPGRGDEGRGLHGRERGRRDRRPRRPGRARPPRARDGRAHAAPRRRRGAAARHRAREHDADARRDEPGARAPRPAAARAARCTRR